MVVVILIFGLFISACSFQDSEALFDLNSCSEATDCNAGETCYKEICVTRKMQPLLVTLEIAPAYNEVSPSNQSKEDASVQNQETGEIEPVVAVVPPFIVTGLGKARRFEVPRLVEVSGTIRYNGARVPAKITFIPIARPDDMNATRTITAITTDQPTLDSKGEPSDFITHVLQNVYYTVIVQPSEESELFAELPPIIEPDFIAVWSTGARLPIEYTAINFLPCSFSLSLPDRQSDVSLNVFAVSSDNPDILVSSWHIIGDGIFEPGGNLIFDLNFFPYIDFIDLIISPFVDRSDQASSEVTDRSKAPIWPVFTVGGFDLENFAQAPIDSEPVQNDNQSVEIKLPSVQQPVTFSGYVDLCEAPPTGKNSGNSYESSNEASNTKLPISFYSKELDVDDDQTGIKSSYSTRTNTERDASTGELKFAVDLLPGLYEVVVSPPLDGPCEVYAKEIPITRETQTESRFQLAAKTHLKGTLKTAKGEPVFGATIHAQALNRDGVDRSNNPMITRFNRSNQTTTDENGRYELSVDLGSYDIIAKPPDASHYGWRVITDVAIDNRGDSFDCDFVFDAPVPVEGVLRYANARKDSIPLSGLEGAEVRVFAIIDEIGDKANGKRNVAIGRVTADQKSNFTALISPSLQSGL
jgi:hypothetical protein